MTEQRRESEHILVLDAGSAMTGGGGLGDATRGEVIVAGMNLIGYDAMTIGAKDLTLGAEALRERIDQATFDVLSANVTREGEDEPFAAPYAILGIGAHRVGVIGITRRPEELPPGFDVLDPELVLSAIVPEVRMSAGTVVLLTDLSLEDAQALVQKAPGIDLVVAGDPAIAPDHAIEVPLTDTLAVCAEMPAARHTGRRVGRLAVTVDVDGKLHDPRWLTEALDDSYADDPAMDELLTMYEVPR